MRQTRVLVLCLVPLVDIFGVTSSTTAMPAILRAVAEGQAAAGLLATTYGMFFGGLLVIGARLGDQYGHKTVLILGLLGYAAACVIGSLAGSVVLLVVARAIQGMMAAVSVPTALRLLIGLSSDSFRRTSIGVWSATAAVGGAAGFVLGGVLTQLLGWPSVFWINLPLIAIVLVAVATLKAPIDREAVGRLDVIGAVLLTAAVMSVVCGASLAQTASNRLADVGLIVLGLVVGAIFVGWQRRAPAPLIPLPAFKSTNLRRGVAVATANSGATGAASLLATLYLQDELDMSPAAAGLQLLPMALGTIGGSALAPRLAKWVGDQRVAGAGLAGVAVGTALLTATMGTVWGVPAGLAVAGVGLGMASVGGTALGTDVPGELTGTASGVLNTGSQIGGAVAVVLGLLLASIIGTGSAWLIIAAAVLLLALALIVSGASAATEADPRQGVTPHTDEP